MIRPTSDRRVAVDVLGLPLHTHVVWPLAARRPRGSERATACTALGRVDRPPTGASDTTSLVLGRRASCPQWPPTAALRALALTRRRAGASCRAGVRKIIGVQPGVADGAAIGVYVAVARGLRCGALPHADAMLHTQCAPRGPPERGWQALPARGALRPRTPQVVRATNEALLDQLWRCAAPGWRARARIILNPRSALSIHPQN